MGASASRVVAAIQEGLLDVESNESVLSDHVERLQEGARRDIPEAECSNDSGFSQLVRELIFSEYLDLYQLQRYRHRFSIEGEPLHYFAIGGRKIADVPPTFLDALDLSDA